MSRPSANEKAGNLSRLDDEFVKIMTEIEKGYSTFSKHERIRIEQWSKKLCQVSVNTIWKQNRNLYAYLLLDCILNKSLKEPFNKIPPEDYLPSLNKHIIKSKIEALQERLNGNELLIYENYQSPPRDKKHQRVTSMGSPDTQPKPEIKARSFPTIEEPNQQYQDSFSIASLVNCLGSPKEIQISSDMARMRGQERVLRSPNTKYVEDDMRYQPNSIDRDMEKMHEQLEKAQLTIENLKDELDVRFRTVSQLNQKVEKLNLEAQEFEKGRALVEIFLENLKSSIRRGTISFQHESIGEDFINQMNELCEVLSLTKLKHKSHHRGGAYSSFSRDKAQEELPEKDKPIPGERKRISSSDEVTLKQYYEEMSSKGLNDQYKNLTCDTHSLQKPRVLEVKSRDQGDGIGISSRNNNKRSDEYINIYHAEKAHK